MAEQRPFEEATAEQGLVRRALRHLDAGVRGAVVVVHRITRGQVLLRVAHGDERQGQRAVTACRLGTRAGLGREAGTTA